MSRTNDLAFFECPICDKKPYIKIYDVSCGTVYCKGGLFSKHKQIRVTATSLRPSQLYPKLSSAWNQTIYRDLKDLPISEVAD